MEKKTLITAEAEMQILVTEPERQYYFIEKAKENLAKLMEQEKRSFTFCVTTFGCQMNAAGFGKTGRHIGTDRVCRRTG